MRRARKLFMVSLCGAFLAAMGVLVSSLLSPARGTENDKGVLAGLISRALSSPGMQVSIGAVDGALSSDATVRNVVIADAQGPWLKVDRVRLTWTRSALLLRRLEIDRLEIGHVEIARRPLPSTTANKGGPLLPQLPVKVILRHFALADLALGKSILGVSAHLSAKGHASLGDPSEGLDLAFDAKRLDAPGAIKLNLSFSPQSQKLKVDLTAQEPAGGLAAHALSLPGSPPLDLNIDGDGTLDSFAARLSFLAGPDAQADGTLKIARSGAERRLDLSLAARVAGLLPADLQPLAQGQSHLDAALRLGDDRSVTIDTASLVTSAARLDASGRIGAAGSLDLHAALRALAQSAASSFRAQRFNVDAAATGTLSEPALAVTLDLAQVKIPAGGLASLKASVSAQAKGALGAPGSHVALAGQGAAAGVYFTDARLASAFGRSLAFALRGDLAPDGTANFSLARLTGDNAGAAFVGQAGPHAVKGRLHIRVDDLASLRGLIGHDVAGSLRADVDLAGAPDKNSVSGALDGEWDRPRTGIAALDGVLGAKLAIKGGLAQAGPKGLSFSNLRLSGEDVSVLLNGGATEKTADLHASLRIPDFRRADPRLAGQASAKAQLTGPLAQPSFAAHVALMDASALGRPIRSMTLDVSGDDLSGALTGKAILAGTIGAKAAQGSLSLARLADGGWRLSPLRLAVGSSLVDGDLTLSAAGLASGRLAAKSSDLDDFSPLLLQKIGGRLDGALTLDASGSHQNARIEIKAQGLRSTLFSAAHLDADLGISDAKAHPVIDGRVAIDRAAFAAQTFPRIRLLAKGSAGASALSLAIQARGWSMMGAGALVASGEPQLDLTRLELRGRGHRIALAAPTVLAWRDGAIQTDGLTLALDSGRLAIAGRVGRSLDLAVSAKSLPLAAAALAAPRLGLSGILNGRVHVFGVPPALSGAWSLTATGVSSASMRSANLPPIKVSAQGDLARGGAQFSGSLAAGAGALIHVAGFAPFTGRGLDLSAKGSLDAALAARVLPDGEKLAGKIGLDVRATGSLKKPLFAGSAALSAGSFADAASGLRLSDLAAQLVAKGDHLRLVRLTGETPGGGSVSVSGRVELKAGFPGQVQIAAHHARLLANEFGTATANLSLEASGPLAQRPRLRGRVDILTMELAVPDQLPHALRPLPNLRMLHPNGAAAARLALAAKRKARAAQRLPFDADIDLDISAANRIFVRGRGLDAEFAGQIGLTGSLSQPIARGAFDLRRGRLDFLTKRLDLSSGRLAFAGGLIPRLDIAAQTTSGGITAQISVTGPANKPVFAFSSTPALPQDEILSRILFAKPSGGLSPFEALQLADFASRLAGGSDGSGAFDKIRKSLGVDSLDVRSDAAGNAQVGASRYINDRMSLGVTTGAKPQDSAVSLGVDVTKRLRAQGQIGADGSSSVGLGMEWNY